MGEIMCTFSVSRTLARVVLAKPPCLSWKFGLELPNPRQPSVLNFVNPRGR
jgi:hypothetical protein